jgi:hypothetical protein
MAHHNIGFNCRSEIRSCYLRNQEKNTIGLPQNAGYQTLEGSPERMTELILQSEGMKEILFLCQITNWQLIPYGIKFSQTLEKSRTFQLSRLPVKT